MQGNQIFSRAASGAGSHRNSSSSVSAFVSTLVPCIALAVVLMGVFLLLRSKERRLYAPRTYHDVLAEDEKTPPAAQSLLGWVKTFRHTSDEYILSHHSLDGYLYVRFFKVLVLMAFVGCIITWPILFPVNATGGGGESGFDILSFSNVNDPTRYFAHALVAWVFFGWVLFLIGREMLYLIKIRQAYLLSTWNASRISQRTVLFTNVPDEFLSHARLRTMFSDVSQIWLVSDTTKLDDDVQDLDDTTLKLEGAEIKMIQKANKKQQKNVDANFRPTHRLKPLIGSKVDTIDYCRDQLKDLVPKVHNAQHSHLSCKERLSNAVFVEFATLAAAQSAYGSTIHDKPATFVARQMGILPDEIIWKNLGMSSWNRSARRAIVTVAIYALILFWSIPVALVGIISNVNYLTANVPFLQWIDSIPSVILGVVTGLLPTVLLAALMALVPIICRVFAKLAGAVSLSEVEQQTQTWYFAFQVIQVFLITTFTSGATAVASQIVSDPTQAVPLLAKNLPKASNFYISYFVLYGVANSAKYLFNLAGLAGVFVLSKFAKTPRKKYMRYIQLTAPSWGSEYPKWTNLGVIAIAYAIISPLVLGFATVGMCLIYLAFKYNMLYVHNTQVDTKGGCYARALHQLMVGVYLAEICLLGLFGIGIGNKATAIGPVVLQVILIIATVAFHLSLRRKLQPLVEVLPLNLLSESEKDPNEMERGDGVAGDSMHPGYHSSHQQTDGPTAFQEEGLVSSSPRVPRDAQRMHTHTKNNDLAQEDRSPEKQSLMKRLFAPHTQSVVSLSASLTSRFRYPVPPYSEQAARDAYLNPSITQEPPVIWLARDPLGISQKEVADLRQALGRFGVEVTDQGATFNEKSKVEWNNTSVMTAPLWEGRVVY